MEKFKCGFFKFTNLGIFFFEGIGLMLFESKGNRGTGIPIQNFCQ
jgi:hypothetical protein